MGSNIVSINPKSECVERLRQSGPRFCRAATEMTDAMLEFATDLWTARQLHESDPLFGAWLAENDLDFVGKNDRAALIHMAENLDLSRRVLEDTDRRSPQHIWAELIAPRLLSSTEERDPEASSNHESSPNAATSEESEKPPAAKEQTNPGPKISPKSPLYGWKRADEVAAIYLNSYTRTTIGKAINRGKGKQIWALILQVIDAGLLTPTDISADMANLRILFPNAKHGFCQKFALMQSDDRKVITEKILPAAIAAKDLILSGDIYDLEAIHNNYWKAIDEAKRKAEAEARLAKEIGAMPADQQEIIMYGERMWPRMNGEIYDYYQLRTAIWHFQDQNRWMDVGSHHTAASKALMMRHGASFLFSYFHHELTDWPLARDRAEKVIKLVSTLSYLMQKNPDGQCIFPSTPKVEGEEWGK